MTPTRDRLTGGFQLDTGTASPLAPRADIWTEVHLYPASADTGIGSPVAQRSDVLNSGDAFIPPLWPR